MKALVVVLIALMAAPAVIRAGMTVIQRCDGVVVAVTDSSFVFQTHCGHPMSSPHDTTVEVRLPSLPLAPTLLRTIKAGDTMQVEFDQGLSTDTTMVYKFMALIMPVDGIVKSHDYDYTTVDSPALGSIRILTHLAKEEVMVGVKIKLGRVAVELDDENPNRFFGASYGNISFP